MQLNLSWLFAHIILTFRISKSDSSSRYEKRTCQEITVPMCKGIGYNETYMPNQFNHDNQEEAGLEVHQFWPLVEIQCSPDLQFFLCSLYTPICIQNYHKPLPACRSVCERAKAGCAPLMRQYGFSWPDKMNCENLPEYGDSENLCMDFNTSAVTTTTLPPVPTKPVKSIQNKQNIKPKASSEEGTDINQYLSFQPGSEIVSKMRRCSCRCNDPLLIGVNETSTYFNKVHTAGVPNCAIRCQDNYFTPDSHRFTMFWIGSWSILCCVSTILTVITFVLDRERFVYPERPIIILSACYFMVGLGYVIRIAFGRQAVGCSQQMIHYATTGPPLCTVVFLLTYFFGMAACIWWVILSLTWFLSAGLKWGQEAIASYSQYFHIVAWIVPSIKSIIILATASVDGDPVSGICYIGNTDSTKLWVFVLIPLFVYLILGISFLLAGFVSLFGIRNTIKQQGEQKIKKLEKLMVKIGVFSIIYTVPATIVIACHLYEQHYREEWAASIACPCKVDKRKPEYSIFMLKYFMYHIVGITSGFWIWSGKTVTAWRSCFLQMTCNKNSNNNIDNVGSKYSSVAYRRTPSLPTPSTKSLCLSQV